MDANSTVAVVYSGHLGVVVPEAGALARRFLIDPLRASVFVAGQHEAGAEVDSRTLWGRLRGLEPIASRSLTPKLTRAQLLSGLEASPSFVTVRRQLRVRQTFRGLNQFAPVLGSRTAHCLHQVHGNSLVFDLLKRYERSAGVRFGRIVFSRLEYVWLAPHPPLEALHRGVLWIPEDGAGSLQLAARACNLLQPVACHTMHPATTCNLLQPAPCHSLQPHATGAEANDRHAVLSRGHARIYLRRWELLHSAALLKRVPLQSLTHDGPEAVLENLLLSHRLRVGRFPGPMYLACCEPGQARADTTVLVAMSFRGSPP